MKPSKTFKFKLMRMRSNLFSATHRSAAAIKQNPQDPSAQAPAAPEPEPAPAPPNEEAIATTIKDVNP